MHYGVAIMIYLISGYFLLEALRFPKESAIFPIGAAVILIVLNTFYLITKVKQDQKSTQSGTETDTSKFNPQMSKGFLVVTGMCLAYAILLNTIGFLLLTPIFLITMMLYIGAKNKKVVISLSLTFTVVIYLCFKSIFNISIPTGVFF